MSDKLIPIKEKAKEWGITVRRVQLMCSDGQIPGSTKIGRCWMVPKDAEKPEDNRRAPGSEAIERENKYKLRVDEKNYVFFSQMSRAIRTSLSSIMGYSDRIILDKKDVMRHEEYAEKIKDSGKNILDLLNDALLLSRFSNDEIEPENTVINIEGVIQSVVDTMEPLAKLNKVRVNVKTDIRHEYVVADQELIKKLLEHIVSNAIKFSNPNGLVTITATEIDSKKRQISEYKYVIEDKGIGMSENFQSQIFEVFATEVSRLSEGKNGAGLGMPIANNIVKLLDGKISIDSELNKGTKVTVILEHQRAEISSDTTDKMDEFDPKEFAGRRILVADDNELNREITRALLIQSGFAVDTAVDGIDCLAKINSARAGSYDLIFMDLQMPNMDGVTATKLIRGLDNKQKATIPVFAMTASVMNSDKESALRAGMNGFIEKPMDLGKTLSLLRKVLK